MAAFVGSFHRQLCKGNSNLLKTFLQTNIVFLNNVRSNHMFKHLSKTSEHKDEYEYEVTNDPEEWSFVEKLMPLETVPTPSKKPNYPSGWRPPSDDAAKKHDYFLERSKNHMLPVYLKTYNINGRLTKVKNIHGDIWKLHEELKAYLEKEKGQKIASFVNEGSNIIQFKGDQVYYCEQWLLSKGF